MRSLMFTGVAVLSLSACRNADVATADATDNPISCIMIGGPRVSPSDVTLHPGDTLGATATWRYCPSGQLASSFLWRSGNPAVATVDAGGLITARSAGSTVITAALPEDTVVMGALALKVQP